jgi:hypothetical protein
MSEEDITRIEDFVRWANERGLKPNVSFHKSPIGTLKKTGRYDIKKNTVTWSGMEYYTAKPKDKRLAGLTYFD